MSRPPALVAMILSALLVSACGSGSGSESGAEADATGAGAEPTSDTRTVTGTVNGDVDGVPVQPERIVALWRTGSELADLGIVPVGQLDGELLQDELSPELYQQVQDVPVVGTFESVDVEQLAAVDPDLIVGMDHGGLELDYEEIATVAPTVILPIEEPTDVWANYPELADVVGVSSDFEARDAELTEELNALESEFGDQLGDLNVTSLGGYDSEIWVETSKSLTYDRLTEAGFGYNDTYTNDPERYSEQLSTENIADLADQDILFYAVEVNGEPSVDTQQILDNPSWQQLPAVQAGHAYPMTSGVIYTFEAAQQQVDDMRAAAEDYTG